MEVVERKHIFDLQITGQAINSVTLDVVPDDDHIGYDTEKIMFVGRDGLHIIQMYRGRVVGVAGVQESPVNWFMSKCSDPFDWQPEVSKTA